MLAPLVALIESGTAVLNRDEPIFFTPGSSVGRGVDHRGISRDPVLAIQSAGKGALELRRLSPTAHIELNGKPFTGARAITSDDLTTGLVLTVAHQFVFVLHAVHFPVTRSPSLGILGAGDAIEDVRRTITRVADLRAPILIRGESGTGKELVRSPRSTKTAGAARSPSSPSMSRLSDTSVPPRISSATRGERLQAPRKATMGISAPPTAARCFSTR